MSKELDRITEALMKTIQRPARASTTRVTGPAGVPMDLVVVSAEFVGADGVGSTVLTSAIRSTDSGFVPNVIVRLSAQPEPQAQPDEVLDESWATDDTVFERTISASGTGSGQVVHVRGTITTPDGVATILASVHDDDYHDYADSIEDVFSNFELRQHA